MAANLVEMDTDAVQRIADGFEAASNVLQGVSKALEMAMNTLKMTAFIGLVGGLAVERYIAGIKPQIDRLAKYCDEVHKDLEVAIKKFVDGDEQGASRFY